jgi:hypothetical protein
MNEQAMRLLELDLHPVLLGKRGEWLKRPVCKEWQTGWVTAAEVAAWPADHNVGIRCGRQRHRLSLVVFDFDENATQIFPAWWAAAAERVSQPLVAVASGCGVHVYCLTAQTYRGRTLAGRYGRENGRRRLFKFIETLGRRRQVVAAGGRHPNGQRYRFLSERGYADLPLLTIAEYKALVALSRSFDQRPPRRTIRAARAAANGNGVDARDCLDYARRYIGAPEQEEPNGDVRFLGHGGLLVTGDGRGWYLFSEEIGGGLADLVAWHRSIGGEG